MLAAELDIGERTLWIIKKDKVTVREQTLKAQGAKSSKGAKHVPLIFISAWKIGFIFHA